MITTIILDDEPYSRNDLKRMLEAGYSDIKIAAVCRNIKETEEALEQFKPELVFLDIELGKRQTTFDLLKRISDIDFEIIFTTAYNKYAIQAIRFSAIDYLLKPVDADELKTAIERFRNKKTKFDSNKIESLIAAWVTPGNQQNKMPLPTLTGYDLITIADIVYCEGVSNQTLIVLTSKKEILISMTLKECEDLLTPYRFFRIHKSYLINLNHVKSYLKGKDGVAIMSNEANLTVSRNFKDKFIEKLRNL